ncbi:hypothetical protein RCS97_05225, partial [Escherichia marmotae]|nr:hypothetical protein [Escherichia marmotae]
SAHIFMLVPVCRPHPAFTPHPAFGTWFTELKNPHLHAAFNRHDLPVRTQHGHDQHRLQRRINGAGGAERHGAKHR